VLSLLCACGAGEPSQEFKVKAAFLYNFARFIEWPGSAFKDANSPFVIAVVGKDPFDGALEQAVSGKTIGNRKVEIRHFDSVDKIGPCQILFVPATDDESERQINEKVKNDPVLTVGESERFVSDGGGAVRFFTDDGKMRFEISTDATDAAQLKVSSKLLKLARIFKK
jgi:hypothetical protein